MRLTTGEQLREINQALKQDQRNYLHEVEQGKARIAELEAELAALKEIPEQAEIAGYKASDGSLMSAESGAMFTAKHMDSYEPLITLAHHNAIVSSLKAKAAVPEGLLDRIDSAITAFTSGRASMHVPPEANDVDMVLAECWKMVKSMLAAAPAQPQNREEPTNDA